jgi:hypothetical protein
MVFRVGGLCEIYRQLPSLPSARALQRCLFHLFCSKIPQTEKPKTREEKSVQDLTSPKQPANVVQVVQVPSDEERIEAVANDLLQHTSLRTLRELARSHFYIETRGTFSKFSGWDEEIDPEELFDIGSRIKEILNEKIAAYTDSILLGSASEMEIVEPIEITEHDLLAQILKSIQEAVDCKIFFQGYVASAMRAGSDAGHALANFYQLVCQNFGLARLTSRQVLILKILSSIKFNLTNYQIMRRVIIEAPGTILGGPSNEIDFLKQERRNPRQLKEIYKTVRDLVGSLEKEIHENLSFSFVNILQFTQIQDGHSAYSDFFLREHHPSLPFTERRVATKKLLLNQVAAFLQNPSQRFYYVMDQGIRSKSMYFLDLTRHRIIWGSGLVVDYVDAASCKEAVLDNVKGSDLRNISFIECYFVQQFKAKL